jgi:hypothetical protein
MKYSSSQLIVFLALLNASVVAFASENPLQLSAAVGTLKYDAKEFSTTGAVINRERGHLPFIQLGLRYTLSDSYFIDTSVRYADQKIRYDGFTQIGIPITTQTQLAWHQATVNLGYRLRWSDRQSLEYSIGIGQRRLDRDIRPTLGSLPLREIMSTSQLNLSARWHQQLGTQTQWHAGIAVQPSLRQNLRVDSYGIFDPITLQLSKHLDSRLFAGFTHSFSTTWRVRGELGMDRIQPEASSTEIWRKNGVPSASVRYPGSKQKSLDLRFEVSTSF